MQYSKNSHFDIDHELWETSLEIIECDFVCGFDGAFGDQKVDKDLENAMHELEMHVKHNNTLEKTYRLPE